LVVARGCAKMVLSSINEHWTTVINHIGLFFILYMKNKGVKIWVQQKQVIIEEEEKII
jgi:hypothetical protein